MFAFNFKWGRVRGVREQEYHIDFQTLANLLASYLWSGMDIENTYALPFESLAVADSFLH